MKLNRVPHPILKIEFYKAISRRGTVCTNERTRDWLAYSEAILFLYRGIFTTILLECLRSLQHQYVNALITQKFVSWHQSRCYYVGVPMYILRQCCTSSMHTAAPHPNFPHPCMYRKTDFRPSFAIKSRAPHRIYFPISYSENAKIL